MSVDAEKISRAIRDCLDRCYRSESILTGLAESIAELQADPERVNPLGGAIAVGHPLGASGAILTTRLIHHMRDKGIKYGLQTICEGGGTANATIYELVE